MQSIVLVTVYSEALLYCDALVSHKAYNQKLLKVNASVWDARCDTCDSKAESVVVLVVVLVISGSDPTNVEALQFEEK